MPRGSSPTAPTPYSPALRVDNIEGSSLDELVVTNSIPLGRRAATCLAKIRQLSVAELLAESMRRINEEESIGSLFMD